MGATRVINEPYHRTGSRNPDASGSGQPILNSPALGVGDELDISNSLTQLIERRSASRQHSFAVLSGNDPLRTSVK